MLTRKQFLAASKRALAMLKNAGIKITAAEAARMEVADFGLNELASTGLEILVYENNARYCAKELILFSRQTCPQHRHPPRNGQPGKMETFRCRWGQVFLYTAGKPCAKPKALAPKGREATYTVWQERVLKPGEQFTVPPDTPHWFQAGPQGAIVSEFSSASDDASDVFEDPEIQRMTKIK